MEALAKLGINLWMLAFQALNFAILLFVLYKFAYGPMITFLDDRTAKIDQGIKDAAEAKEMLKKALEQEAQIMLDAQKEAKKVIDLAMQQAKKQAESTLQLAEAQSARMIEDARAQSIQDAQRLLNDAKKDLSEVVMSAVEKVIQQKLDATADADLIKKIIS